MACVSLTMAIILLVLAVHIWSSAQAVCAGRPQKDVCKLSDIVVSQVKTGKIMEGQQEYRVTVENMCRCPQANIKVRCFGLSSVEPIDRSKIRPVDGELCVVANGKAIAKGRPVTFTYAFQTPQSFLVVDARTQCLVRDSIK